MAEALLTTIDNPFDPFTQWIEWYTWDAANGYHTPGLLARMTVTSPDLSEADQSEAIDRAMDLIVRQNFSGVHRKVYKET